MFGIHVPFVNKDTSMLGHCIPFVNENACEMPAVNLESPVHEQLQCTCTLYTPTCVHVFSGMACKRINTEPCV